MYTGALENDPPLLDRLAKLKPLYGNAGTTVRRARDPVFWTAALADAGLPTARVALSPDGLSRDGRWLRKRLHSAAGMGVEVWDDFAAGHASGSSDVVFFQERIDGTPVSAAFVGNAEEASLLGITRQLIGLDWRHALRPHSTGQQFRYAGSIGPLVVPTAIHAQALNVGNTLAEKCGLVGLFGVDAILTADAFVPVEINPRYTASIEVLERASALRTADRRATRFLSIACHEAACCFSTLPATLGQSSAAIAGKLILYAQKDLVFNNHAARWVAARNLAQAKPAVADIPKAGSAISASQPILTLLADGEDEKRVTSQLREMAEELERLLQRR